MNILLLEDDTLLHESLKIFLELEDFKVTSAFSAKEAYDAAFDKRFDLYIFDVNLPDESGFEVLKALKSSGDETPTIYTTALVDINSISEGFLAGADDYIKKPFDPEELVIRIKSRYMKKVDTIIYKDIVYNPLTKEILKEGEPIILTQLLANIFHLLITHKNQVVPLERLYDELTHPSANALRVSLSKLKKSLNINIINVRNVGYQLERV